MSGDKLDSPRQIVDSRVPAYDLKVRRREMTIRVSAVLTSVLVLTACASTTSRLPVRTEYNKETPFHEWKSFRFSSNTKGSDYQRYPRFERMAQEALERELTARGYTRLEVGSPDFRVAFELIFRGGTTPHPVPEGRGAEPMATTYGVSSQRGTLVVRMLDPVTSNVQWTGQISEIKMNAIEPQKELEKAVRRLLVEFPPLTG
jgi:hypothetical protein